MKAPTVPSRTNEWDLSISDYPTPQTGLHLETLGSKNCALPIIMYCYLLDSSQTVVLQNIPDISDVHCTIEMLKLMGGQAHYDKKDHTLYITQGITSDHLPIELMSQVRISVLLMSIMLVRRGRVKFPKQTGGCKLGERPINYHLSAFVTLGCTVNEDEEGYEIVWKDRDKTNPVIDFPQATTTGTENALFLASFSSTDVTIKSAHLRPEIIELIRFMNKLGADIEHDGDEIIVHKRKPLDHTDVSHRIISDPEEAISYLGLSVLTGSSGTIAFDNGYPCKEIDLLTRLSRGKISRVGKTLKQEAIPKAQKHRQVVIETGPYPEIGSDSQPILAAILLRMAQSYRIIENRFTNRFAYAQYLQGYGVTTAQNGSTLEVSNTDRVPGKLIQSPSSLVCYDLRSAINALLTATHFQCSTTITQAQILERGYSGIIEKLDRMGYKYSTNARRQ